MKTFGTISGCMNRKDDMQAENFCNPLFFIAWMMFLVPSDIMVVGAVLFLVPRTMMTASVPWTVLSTSSWFRTSPLTISTLSLNSAGIVDSSRTRILTFFPAIRNIVVRSSACCHAVTFLESRSHHTTSSHAGSAENRQFIQRHSLVELHLDKLMCSVTVNLI